LATPRRTAPRRSRHSSHRPADAGDGIALRLSCRHATNMAIISSPGGRGNSAHRRPPSHLATNSLPIPSGCE
jgi:hypothetical protein